MKQRKKEKINRVYDMSQWETYLIRMGVGIYLLICFMEIAMFFVMQQQGLVYQSVGTYVLRYIVKPIVISTVILLSGIMITKLIKNMDRKIGIYMIMITMLFGNIVYIHNVFIVLYFIFCVPIFMTVIFQNPYLLNAITFLSEAYVLGVSLYVKSRDLTVSRMEYFVPSVIIIMVVLIVCRFIALQSIKLLQKQSGDLEDMTHQALEARRLADESNQSKSMFLSNLSHEIRTPINAVLGLDEMIIRESNEENIKDYAQDIRSSGKTLLSLVNDVLDISKIEAGKLELVKVDYDVSSFINDIVNMISGKVYDKGLSFQLEIKDDIPHLLYGDEIRIKQIIMNLLSNAVKYTNMGEVKLCMSCQKMDDEHIMLSVMVRDTGKGIKKEDMDKLFAPFERIEEQQNRNIEGTGLGMSITKQLLALMDSQLVVESVYGLGSDFSFEIIQTVRDWSPIGDYQKAYQKLKKQEGTYKEFFKAPDAKILVVDDTPLNIKVFKGLLKKTEVQIDEAYSGKDGIKMAEKEAYDILFIDHMMPDIDGIETLKRIKQAGGVNANKPMIALTANAVSGSREMYLKEGFAEYITKPIEADKLEKTIIRFLPETLVKTEEEG
ncbi:MAG: response regulator [Lachnospiraceae bacterium]